MNAELALVDRITGLTDEGIDLLLSFHEVFFRGSNTDVEVDQITIRNQQLLSSRNSKFQHQHQKILDEFIATMGSVKNCSGKAIRAYMAKWYRCFSVNKSPFGFRHPVMAIASFAETPRGYEERTKLIQPLFSLGLQGLHITGSMASRIALWSSDIDLAYDGTHTTGSQINYLKNILPRVRRLYPTKEVYIRGAKYPIIHINTSPPIDLSAKRGSIVLHELLNVLIVRMPPMRNLLIILKRFLHVFQIAKPLYGFPSSASFYVLFLSFTVETNDAVLIEAQYDPCSVFKRFLMYLKKFEPARAYATVAGLNIRCRAPAVCASDFLIVLEPYENKNSAANTRESTWEIVLCAIDLLLDKGLHLLEL